MGVGVSDVAEVNVYFDRGRLGRQLLHASLRLQNMILNIRRRETIDAELLPDLDGIGGVRDFAAEVSGVRAKPQAGVTHGGRLGVLWGTAGVKGSGIGAILTARAEENR